MCSVVCVCVCVLGVGERSAKKTHNILFDLYLYGLVLTGSDITPFSLHQNLIMCQTSFQSWEQESWTDYNGSLLHRV